MEMVVRKFLSSFLMYAGFLVGFAFAATWCYWIWGFEWGRGRSAGLWWMAFCIGGIISGLIGLFIVTSIRMWLFPEEHR
jgi:hypothetical protein